MDAWPSANVIAESMLDCESKNGKKQNNNFARAWRFFVHFFVVIAQVRRETPYVHVLWRTWAQENWQLVYISEQLNLQPFRIQLQKNSPAFDKLNDMEFAR